MTMQAKILVVDDESVTRRVVTHTLKSIDIEALGAADATQALELAQREHFGLALVDINLPDLDGFELVKQLKSLKNMRDVPIIMFTARNNQEDRTRAVDAGAVSLLYKPFSTQELRELVTRYLSYP